MLARPDLLVPLILFCAVTSFTPGPNNVMLMSLGFNFGVRRTLPYMLGVNLAFIFQLSCSGLGLGIIFTNHPVLYTIIKYLGTAYMLYLAWSIAQSDSIDSESASEKKPLTLPQAFVFQSMNTKAWIMAIGGVSAYAVITAYPWNILLIASLFFVIGLISDISWVVFGKLLQRFLHKPRILRAFNIIMAMLLAASLYPVLAEAWQ